MPPRSSRSRNVSKSRKKKSNSKSATSCRRLANYTHALYACALLADCWVPAFAQQATDERERREAELRRQLESTEKQLREERERQEQMHREQQEAAERARQLDQQLAQALAEREAAIKVRFFLRDPHFWQHLSSCVSVPPPLCRRKLKPPRRCVLLITFSRSDSQSAMVCALSLAACAARAGAEAA